ncbi:ABC transporter ATP-binding protein [Zhengella mangrovi]|nr:ABC transporter ATP-binding protein [Zhengella mangrovi]
MQKTDSSASIQLVNVSLKVPVSIANTSPPDAGWRQILRRSIFQRYRRQFNEILSDINLTIYSGDRIAFIGRNGAGKTTLLRMLTGAYAPTTGIIEKIGRSVSLMNISLGMNFQASVLENIYLRGTAFGLTQIQLTKAVKGILEFADLNDKIGAPLDTLSAGQRMRLAFAISTCYPADIVIMDEWIGAGDQYFLNKAKERLRSHIEGAQIVVLASHNNAIIREVCNRAIILEEGKLVFDGSVEDAIKVYGERNR